MSPRSLTRLRSCLRDLQFSPGHSSIASSRIRIQIFAWFWTHRVCSFRHAHITLKEFRTLKSIRTYWNRCQDQALRWGFIEIRELSQILHRMVFPCISCERSVDCSDSSRQEASFFSWRDEGSAKVEASPSLHLLCHNITTQNVWLFAESRQPGEHWFTVNEHDLVFFCAWHTYSTRANDQPFTCSCC